MTRLFKKIFLCKIKHIHAYQPWRQVYVESGQLKSSPIQDAVCERCGTIALNFYHPSPLSRKRGVSRNGTT